MTTVVDYLFPFRFFFAIHPPGAHAAGAGPTRAAPSRVSFCRERIRSPRLGFRVPRSCARARARALLGGGARAPLRQPLAPFDAVPAGPARLGGGLICSPEVWQKSTGVIGDSRLSRRRNVSSCVHTEALRVAVGRRRATLSAAGAGGPGPPSIASHFLAAKLASLNSAPKPLSSCCTHRVVNSFAGDPRYFTTTSFASPSFICDTA